MQQEYYVAHRVVEMFVTCIIHVNLLRYLIFPIRIHLISITVRALPHHCNGDSSFLWGFFIYL